jgi:ABC-type transport system involved in cytochrome c biogenesis permease component
MSLGQRGAASDGSFHGLPLLSTLRNRAARRRQRALILLGASPTAFFYSKALVNFVGLFVVGILLTPISAALFGVGPSLGGGLVILALGTLSLSAPGTLFTAIVSESDKRHLLLPVMMFPLVVPVLITVVQSTLLLTFGDAMGQASAWNSLLTIFAAALASDGHFIRGGGRPPGA